jgi:acyl carrier protein
MTAGEIRGIIVQCLRQRLQKHGYDPSSVSDDVDLLNQGIIDSFDFISLIDELEAKCNASIDITRLDDEGMTTLGGLTREVERIIKSQRG